MSRRRGKNQEEHVDESWLIPYADILTLLLALFIVLFAASSVDAQKFEKLAESLKVAFTGGTGVMEHHAPVVPPDDIPVTPDEPEETLDEEQLAEFYASQQDLEDLKQLQEKINDYIQEENLGLSLQTEMTKEGLLLTILDDALFTSGSAEIRPDAVQLAREMSHLLVTEPQRHIQIAGHTDNVPIGDGNQNFRSNWDLSAMRAINFLKILLENEALEPPIFSASGYGEYHPVASNENEEGRAQNRRVEVLILPYSQSQ
ncbi:flagellar motor protein MotB [Caldalkalibacillus salinus]|uniref:flagellar motor protein MotB n=1 Tax=Caldalkalibacillus salinus TaxID=2803787 RepID=UPI0019236952|nr:flagellar motor protein MotB [Caldalkalibacillus salinus]